MDYHGNKDVTEDCKKEEYFKKRDKRGDDTPLELEQLAVKLNERLENIGYETPDTKWQQHASESIYEPYDSKKYHAVDDESDCAVKIVGLCMRHSAV